MCQLEFGLVHWCVAKCLLIILAVIVSALACARLWISAPDRIPILSRCSLRLIVPRFPTTTEVTLVWYPGHCFDRSAASSAHFLLFWASLSLINGSQAQATSDYGIVFLPVSTTRSGLLAAIGSIVGRHWSTINVVPFPSSTPPRSVPVFSLIPSGTGTPRFLPTTLSTLYRIPSSAWYMDHLYPSQAVS